ncbi:MAG: beta-galactosidase [Leptospiraceae bacterium]|nr:beta-galactosidase [Leptospiraceae bacterium]
MFGVDYYPEQWTEKDWDEDITILKNLGITSVRIGEFTWALLEPEEGKFDFSFLDAILEKFHKAELSVVLGTPTASIPPWLYNKYREVVQTSIDGIERIVGTRRQGCFSSKEFWVASERIVTSLAKRYGKHPAIIGWQIDNEPGHEGSDISYSRSSLKKFRKWLKAKYKTIQNLNYSWGNVFWSAIYNSFEEIELPGRHVASNFNPSMIQDFYRFNSDSLIQYIEMQIDILKKYTQNQILFTNLYPSPFLPVTDMEQLVKKLDLVAWDNYPVWGPLKEPYPHPFVSACLEYSRGLKNKNFIVAEQFSGMQGHDILGYLPAPGQIGLWMMQSIAHGAEELYFFRYRTARFGQEQLCYGILDHSKDITWKYKEIKTTIQQIRQYADDFINEDVPASVAIIHDIDNVRNLKHQPISEGLKLSPVPFAQVGYDVEIANWYAALNVLNVNTHIVPSASTDLNKYKVVVLPLYFMMDKEFVETIESYVRNGGILILGYRAGIKDKNGWMIDKIPPCYFTSMAGVQVSRFEAVGNDLVKLKFGLLRGNCSKICEIVEPLTARVMARYNDKKKHYKGEAVITVNRYHKGKVYYVGSSLTPSTFLIFYYKVLKKAGIKTHFYGRYIERVFRKGKLHDYEILLNHSHSTKWVGWKKLKPYEFKIVPLKKSM